MELPLPATLNRPLIHRSLPTRLHSHRSRLPLRVTGNTRSTHLLLDRITQAANLVAPIMSQTNLKTPKLITVSERNLQNAAIRLLPKHNRLVSPEVEYLRRVLGDRATQIEIDEKVQQVRRLPWSQIVVD